MYPLLAFLSLAIERAFGYPRWLSGAIGHPVMWIGALIALLDRRLNRDNDTPSRRRGAGIATLVIVIAAAALPALALQVLVSATPLGIVVIAILAGALLAQRSLDEHVAAVADALERDGLTGGRRAVAQIVGRDPDNLDEAGVARAAIESLAENFSDGVTAPAFWIGVGGLAGGTVYKAINTADSVIGHRTPRHEAFGWASARLDDLINLPASRLTALLLVGAAFLVPGASPGSAWCAVRRDARHHRSPNAGWPEAAMAGALGLALAGSRIYGGTRVEDAIMGEGGRREATADDIRRALTLYRVADVLLLVLFALLAAIFILLF